jgi:hypothetical protein
VQRPHPPIWIGGNSRRAMRRAVLHGQGWMPFPQPVEATRLTRTPPLETFEDLSTRTTALREMSAEAGRSDVPQVCFVPFGMRMQQSPGPAEFAELAVRMGAYTAAGVDWLSVSFSASTREGLLELVAAFAELVIEPVRRPCAAATP